MPDSSGLLIVISGPSGVGKTTISRQVTKQLDAGYSISMTTRPMTADDIDGKDYHFVSVEQFKEAIDSGQLAEWAKVFDNYYGTPKQPVQEMLDDGRDVILEIDVNGAIQIKKAMPHAVTIFILPPSEETLLTRLRSRGREDETIIQKRFSEAQREIEQAQQCGAYTDFVFNDQLDVAIEETLTKINQHRTAAT